MSKPTDAKQTRGEHELVQLLRALTGHAVKLDPGAVRIVGLPGWFVLCRRVSTATRANVADWWFDAAGQTNLFTGPGVLPLLCWRADRMRDWVFHWPAGLYVTDMQEVPLDVSKTLSSEPLTWWLMTAPLMPEAPAWKRPWPLSTERRSYWPDPRRGRKWAGPS